MASTKPSLPKREVKVSWLDANGHAEWCTWGEALDVRPTQCLTRGVVIEETEDYITVAQTSFEKTPAGQLPQYCHVLCIPKKGVLNVRPA